MTQKLTAANDVLRELNSKLSTAQASHVALDEQRHAIAFEAHTSADLAVRKRLAALDADRVKLTNDIDSLGVAIVEAVRRVDEAEREIAMAGEIEAARRAREIGQGFLGRAKRIDEALAVIVAESLAVKEEIFVLGQLDVRNPNLSQFISFGTRALLAGIMLSPLKIEHLAPGERHTFAEVMAIWSSNIERQTTAILDQEAAA